MNLERRSFEAELRAETSGGEDRLVGYAAVFNSRSADLGGFTEIIKPGAFTRSLEGAGDIKALVNHNSDYVLGSKRAGTLALEQDERGLKVTIRPPNTSYAQDLLESVRRGDQSGMSFGFFTEKDEWRIEDGGTIRELHSVGLFEVSTTAFPAYPATDVAVARRSLEAWQAGKWAPSVDFLRRRLRFKEKSA